MFLRIIRIPRDSFASSRLLHNSSGLTTIEFAIVAPILILLIMGIIEFSMIMYTSATMESATAATARTGKTGYIAQGLTRQQTIINAITARTVGLLDPNKITVTTTIYPTFDSVSQPEPYTDSNGNGTYNTGEPYTDINGNGQWDADMGDAGLGNGGDIVVYNISYPWDVVTPIISAFTGTPFPITVRTVVKNEPF